MAGKVPRLSPFGVRFVRAAVVVFLTLVALIVFGVTYVQHVADELDRRDVQRQREICALIVLIDDLNRKHPTTDPDTITFRNTLHAYRISIGCDTAGKGK